jgi:hypothetical protein
MPLPAAPTAPTASSSVPENIEHHHLAVAQQSHDYLRRIHWWVRLFGVVWLAGILLTVLGFLTVAYQAGQEADRLDTVTTTTSGTGEHCSVFGSGVWSEVPCD